MDIASHSYTKELLNDPDISQLSLKSELAKLNLFSKKQMKSVPNSLICWDQTGYLLHLKTEKSASRYVSDLIKIDASLNETRKVTYRPKFEPQIFGGLASGYMYDSDVNFYRAIHVDTAPFLSVNNLWLAVPEFAAILDKFLPTENLHSSLEKVGDFYVPRLKIKRNFLNGDRLPSVREWVGDIDNALEWNDAASEWQQVSDD
jgi:hypothetical protein